MLINIISIIIIGTFNIPSEGLWLVGGCWIFLQKGSDWSVDYYYYYYYYYWDVEHSFRGAVIGWRVLDIPSEGLWLVGWLVLKLLLLGRWISFRGALIGRLIDIIIIIIGTLNIPSEGLWLVGGCWIFLQRGSDWSVDYYYYYWDVEHSFRGAVIGWRVLDIPSEGLWLVGWLILKFIYWDVEYSFRGTLIGRRVLDIPSEGLWLVGWLILLLLLGRWIFLQRGCDWSEGVGYSFRGALIGRLINITFINLPEPPVWSGWKPGEALIGIRCSRFGRHLFPSRLPDSCWVQSLEAQSSEGLSLAEFKRDWRFKVKRNLKVQRLEVQSLEEFESSEFRGSYKFRV
jgi:hypothetical protein